VAQDNGGTADGSVDTSVQTFTVTINPVNDAPLVTVPGAQTGYEDVDLALAGISVGDLEAAEGTGRVQVKGIARRLVPEDAVAVRLYHRRGTGGGPGRGQRGLTRRVTATPFVRSAKPPLPSTALPGPWAPAGAPQGDGVTGCDEPTGIRCRAAGAPLGGTGGWICGSGLFSMTAGRATVGGVGPAGRATGGVAGSW
jgi:hypothetical protein